MRGAASMRCQPRRLHGIWCATLALTKPSQIRSAVPYQLSLTAGCCTGAKFSCFKRDAHSARCLPECSNAIDRFADWSCELHDPYSTTKGGGVVGALGRDVASLVNSLVDGSPGSVKVVLDDISSKGADMGVSSASQVHVLAVRQSCNAPLRMPRARRALPFCVLVADSDHGPLHRGRRDYRALCRVLRA